MSKTALVTGASLGIGRCIAGTLAREGYNLHLTCRNNIEALHVYAKELSDTYGITAMAYLSDASDADATQALFKTIAATSIPDIDVLINNAGMAHFALLQDMTPTDWNNVIATNLSSVYLLSKGVIPGMVARQSGRIINISSVWGRVGSSMESAYSASKGGMDSLTRALARELAPSRIAVNSVACGLIDTDMNHCLSAEDLSALIDEIPAGRIGKPEEVAETVNLLLKAPLYLTGQIIGIDGGWT